MSKTVRPRALKRRAPRTQTARAEAIAACARHLADLRRAHGRPPADVIEPRGAPVRLSPAAPSSYCTSPADLCAGLAK